MRRLFTKQQLLTVPNLLSVVRLLLIPLMVYLYCEKQAYTAVVWVLLISGLTDVVDGFIARRFHAVSDLGKLLYSSAVARADARRHNNKCCFHIVKLPFDF